MSTFFAVVALESPVSADAEGTLVNVRNICDPMSNDVRISMPKLKHSENGFVLTINGVDIVVIVMSEPLPQAAYEDAASASLLWKDAKVQLAESKGHIVVSTMRKSETHAEALASAFGVTVVAAAIIGMTSAIGVVFNPAQTVFPAQDFRSMAIELAQRQQIPEMIWCSLAFVQGETSTAGNPQVGAVATGLFPFVGRDLEFEPMPWPPGEVAQRVLGLAQYLMLRGPVIKDGDSVGNNPDEKLVARLKDRGRWLSYPVIAISGELAA